MQSFIDYKNVRINQQDYGFKVDFDNITCATGGGGNGQASLTYNNAGEEGVWDVPSIEIGFDDPTEDLSCLVLCTSEILMWAVANKGLIDAHKRAWDKEAYQ